MGDTEQIDYWIRIEYATHWPQPPSIGASALPFPPPTPSVYIFTNKSNLQ